MFHCTMVGGGVINDFDFLAFLHATIYIMKGIESLFALNTDLPMKIKFQKCLVSLENGLRLEFTK